MSIKEQENLCSESVNSAKAASGNEHYIKLPSHNFNESEKLMPDPHPDSDQHQNLIVCRGSPLAKVYHVWSTSVHALMSYPAHSQTERQTNSKDHITPP